MITKVHKSQEFKEIKRKFKLQTWYEMVDIKTSDFLVYDSQLEDVVDALNKAGIMYSVSGYANGIYGWRLSLLRFMHDSESTK